MISIGWGVAIVVVIIDIGEVIEVAMIGVGEMGFNVVTCCMGDEGIRTSVMKFGAKACTGMTRWMGGEGILYVMIFFGTSAENFSTSVALFVVTSLASLGVQKKVSSESDFGCRDVKDEVISFVSSASESQKKEISETGFMRGVAGDEMTLLGGPIQSFTTC